ncbi:hypothetical protein Sps_00932 [Shewanella psychrophila]|uniref:Uncharacterized protein n=1 Tax=Shewanella psychrophila TaxID=225848 RepID=A0A1S6HKR2_9GAMM|nr:hypothetical protein [Shewanella psychrophila]AQS36121.1 hypothetical protein Sps_00932 [Shewanella psychrophila]
MITQGLIMDVDDIVIKDKLDFNTGEVKSQYAVVGVSMLSPTCVVKVTVSPELYGDGKTMPYLKSMAGTFKPFTLSLDYRQSSFADEKGMHKEFQGFHLYKSPAENSTSHSKAG